MEEETFARTARACDLPREFSCKLYDMLHLLYYTVLYYADILYIIPCSTLYDIFQFCFIILEHMEFSMVI